MEVLSGVVVTGNVAVVMPLGINTNGGTDTAKLLLSNPTATPVTGACPVRVIVIVDEFPPTTDEGLAVNALTERLLTLIKAVLVIPPDVAVIVAETSLASVAVVTVKVAWVDPAGIETDGGTPTERLLLVSMTSSPPEGAGWAKVMVPTELVPPITVVGLIVKLLRATELKNGLTPTSRAPDPTAYWLPLCETATGNVKLL